MFQQIVDALSNVVELDLIGYNLGEYRSQHNNIVPYSYRGISKQSVDDICRFLSHFTGLKVLRLYHNDMQEAGALKI